MKPFPFGNKKKDINITGQEEDTFEYHTNKATSLTEVIGLIDKYIYEKFDNKDIEHFGMICLTEDHTILGIKILSRGTAYEAIASPRQIIKTALLMDAKGIILFHNHPDDTATPSNEDIKITELMISIGKELNVTVVDHFIKGTDRTLSMYREGYITDED